MRIAGVAIYGLALRLGWLAGSRGNVLFWAQRDRARTFCVFPGRKVSAGSGGGSRAGQLSYHIAMRWMALRMEG